MVLNLGDANEILKQYLFKGYAINQRMFDIEQKVVEQGMEITEIKKKRYSS